MDCYANGKVTIEEYNWSVPLGYSTRTINMWGVPGHNGYIF